METTRMHRMLVLTAAFVVAAVIACSREAKPDFAAAEAAKGYYDDLAGGRFDHFVDGMNLPHPVPDGYREQLVANAQMFLSEMKATHKGLSEVRVLNNVLDSTQLHANAFLLLCFADSTSEQVVVPMVKHEERWLMR